MIVVRPARVDEVLDLADIGLASWRQGIGPLVDEAVVRRIAEENPFLPLLGRLGAGVLVAEWQGRPAGIGASEHADNQISDIWVAPDAEGRGLGSALVRALERQIAGRGYPEALIEVAADNMRAHGLYRHLGYEPWWQRAVFDPILRTTLAKVGLRKLL